MFALGTDAFLVAGVLPVIAHETEVGEGLVGQFIVLSLTYGLGAPILAITTGHWRPERVLMGALGLLGPANLASALSPSFPLLVLTRLLAGCFAATYTSLAFAVGIELAPPDRRGQALALVDSGLNVATVLGAPSGAWIGEHFGWRLSFAVVARLAGLAFLLLMLFQLPLIERAALADHLPARGFDPPPRFPVEYRRVCLVSLHCLAATTAVARRGCECSARLLWLGILLANRMRGRLSDRFGPTPLVVLGIDGGAAVGGLALRWLSTARLASLGVISMLTTLLIVASTVPLRRRTGEA